MKFGSLFSGIGGFDLGFEQAGLSCSWQVELDADCNKVLEARYPKVKRIRDVKDAGKDNLEPVDVIAFGWPCQDLSVAGLRAGISGERSGLFHEAARVIQELRPKWIVAENVPGLFSSYTPVDAPPSNVAIGTEWEVEEDSDFERVLATLDDLGYCVSWRVCDAQFWGVAQRRERVFLVGSLGSLRSCEVFPFAESLPGDFETRREAGAGVTPILEAGARTNSDGRRDGDGIGVEGDPMFTLQSGKQHAVAANNFGERDISTALSSKNERIDGDTETFVVANNSEITMPLKAKANSSHDESHETYVTHALRSEGADASEDGTGGGTPIVVNCFNGYTGGPDDNDAQANHIVSVDLQNTRLGGDVTGSLDTTRPSRGGGQAVVAFAENQRGEVRTSDISPQLSCAGGKPGSGYPAVAFGWNKSDSQTMRVDEETTDALQSSPQSNPAIAFSAGQGSKARSVAASVEHTPPLKAAESGTNKVPSVSGGFGVRRLTPRECERLMGLPDDWTLYDAAGKIISDSARYRMLGNSIVVPVSRWIGKRIMEAAENEQRTLALTVAHR